MVRRIVLMVWLAGAMSSMAQENAGAGADDLSRQATDPTASLMSLQFIGGYVGGYQGDQPDLDDTRSELKLQSAIPFTAFSQPNILRITLPYQLDGRGDEGLGDVSIFDLVVIPESWGRWGVGPVVTLATADAAPDDIVAGPAIGGVYQYSKKLNFGLFNQNVFGGDTGISQLQPIVAYQMGDGWSLSGGDLQYTYDWKADRWVNLPIGCQLGKVTKLAGQPVRFAVNPQYNLKDGEGLEEWRVSATFALLMPVK